MTIERLGNSGVLGIHGFDFPLSVDQICHKCTIESCVVNQCCMNKSQLSYDVFVQMIDIFGNLVLSCSLKMCTGNYMLTFIFLLCYVLVTIIMHVPK